MLDDTAPPSPEGGADDAVPSPASDPVLDDRVSAALGTVIPSARPFYHLLSDTGRPMTAQEMCAGLGLSRGSGDRVNNLYRAGLIEPLTAMATLDNGRRARMWKLTSPDRIATVAAQAAKKPPRRKSVLDATPQQRAHLIKLLIRDPEVDKILLEEKDRSTAAQHARREVRDYQNELRRLEAEEKRARAEGLPVRRYYTAKIAMTKAAETLRGMAREVAKEADVRSAFGDPSVSDNLWADVRADAEKYEGLAARLRKVITKMLGDDVIDTEGWDPAEYAEKFGIEDAEIVYELPPGFEDAEIIDDDEFPSG